MSLIGKTLSGAEFNKIYKVFTFYKFLNDNLIHHGFKYMLGLNEDTKDGLSFCDESPFHLRFEKYGPILAFIEIPDDAQIYVEKDRFKTDKLIITQISDLSNDFFDDICQKNNSLLQIIKECELHNELARQIL